MTDLDTRLLPHNLDAEKAVLGAILMRSSAIVSVQEHLQPGDFFRRAHQAIYAAMLRLVDDQHSAVDPITIMAELKRSGEEAEVGGPAYVAALIDGLPQSSNIRHHAGIVKAAAQRRALITLGNRMVADAYDGAASTDEIIASADHAIIDLQKGATSGRTVDLRETFSQLYADLEYRANHRGELSGIDTGFASINDMTHGLQRGDMIVLAARPSIGKTILAMNMAEAAAAAGHGVLVFSLEMRRLQLEQRRLAHLASVPLNVILSGWLSEGDWEAVARATTLMSERPIWVDDRSGQTVGDIRATARRMRAEKKIDLVIIDYVQLVAGSLARRGATRNEELSDVSRRLKVLADEVSCPVVVLSQLNRDGASRSDKRPVMSDLRDTGALEQDADIVAFLHRSHHAADGPTFFILEKQRQGAPGTVNLVIQRATQTFTDGGIEPEQAAIPEATTMTPPVDVTDARPRKRWYR